GAEPHNLRTGVDLCRRRKQRTPEALLDNPIVLYIPIGKKGAYQQRQGKEPEECIMHHGVGLPPATSAARDDLATLREFHFDGQDMMIPYPQSNFRSASVSGSGKRLKIKGFAVDSKSGAPLPTYLDACQRSDGCARAGSDGVICRKERRVESAWGGECKARAAV